MINELNYRSGKDIYDTGYVLHYPEGDYSLERPIPNKYVPSKGDLVHTVMDGETLQSIAFRYFGDSGYWASIAEVNNIVNPLSEEEFYIGRKLIISIYGSTE